MIRHKALYVKRYGTGHNPVSVLELDRLVKEGWEQVGFSTLITPDAYTWHEVYLLRKEELEDFTMFVEELTMAEVPSSGAGA